MTGPPSPGRSSRDEADRAASQRPRGRSPLQTIDLDGRRPAHRSPPPDRWRGPDLPAGRHLAGALGSFVQVATSFSTFVGNQRFELSSGWRSEIVNSTLTTCRSQHPLALGSRVHQAARMTAAMVSLMVEQLTSLREWFLPDRPGPLVGLHIIQTGNGVAWAD